MHQSITMDFQNQSGRPSSTHTNESSQVDPFEPRGDSITKQKRDSTERPPSTHTTSSSQVDPFDSKGKTSHEQQRNSSDRPPSTHTNSSSQIDPLDSKGKAANRNSTERPASTHTTNSSSVDPFEARDKVPYATQRDSSEKAASTHSEESDSFSADPFEAWRSRAPWRRNSRWTQGRSRTSSLSGSTVSLPAPVQLPKSKAAVSESVVSLGSEKSVYLEGLEKFHEAAKAHTKRQTRSLWQQRAFQCSVYGLLICILYFLLIGKPLWNGAVFSLWSVYGSFSLEAGVMIYISFGLFYSAGPLLGWMQPDPVVDEEFPAEQREKAQDTCLIIPCYKSAAAITATLEAALPIFPARNIFVMDNGNSPTPFDETKDICEKYGVRYFWVDTGSKIIAQFIACQAASEFKYALLIDDDCTLPSNFPLRTERIELGDKKGAVKCLGYTITSVGTNASRGTMAQQAQDMEYKLGGNTRYWYGKWSSATFPHGAIALWDRAFLEECFKQHPGFTISEDWFFGHVCRLSGGRIQMCSEIFVQTETPPALMFGSRSGSRAGYGEMTVSKQRMTRWNFFLVSRVWEDTLYLLFAWNLGIYEIGAKLLVFQEIYESLLLLTGPIFTPIAFAIRPAFTAYITVAVMVMYVSTVVIFNEIHLRRKGAMVGRKAAYLYYPPYKVVLGLLNIWSCYRACWMYARYFRTRHPAIYENERAMANLVRLSQTPAFTAEIQIVSEKPGQELEKKATVTVEIIETPASSSSAQETEVKATVSVEIVEVPAPPPPARVRFSVAEAPPADAGPSRVGGEKSEKRQRKDSHMV